MDWKLAIEIAGWAVAGGLGLFGIFNTTMRKRSGENDEVSSRLINNLKLTADQQEKTISQLTTKLDQTTKELHLMQGRNSVLEGLFNGNENSILAFLKQAPALMEIGKDNNKLSHQNNAAITELTSTFEKFINTLQPILTHLERIAGEAASA